MDVGLEIRVNQHNVRALRQLRRAILRATRKAGTTGLRDMRSAASKQVRARKRLKVKRVNQSLVRRTGRVLGSSLEGTWAIDVRGDVVPLSEYPHRQVKTRGKRKGGVNVTVNRGKRSRIPGAFVATMGSGHKGIFKRKGRARLPIQELLGSRPVDALSHKGEAEAALRRGRESFVATFDRLLPLELDKLRG